MPSAVEHPVEESEGCVVGELIKLDDEGAGSTKAVEVFLAEGRLGRGGARRLEMGGYKGKGRRGREPPGEEKSVQTEETSGKR